MPAPPFFFFFLGFFFFFFASVRRRGKRQNICTEPHVVGEGKGWGARTSCSGALGGSVAFFVVVAFYIAICGRAVSSGGLAVGLLH